MNKLEAKALREFEEELEKLTIDELNQKQKEIIGEREQYQSESSRKQRMISLAIKVNRIIDIYKKEGFKGIYKEFAEWYDSPEDNIPF